MKDGYLPPNERKKILLLSDDLRLPSGVGVMSKEIVVGTAHHYNWVQLGAAINHPEVGKAYDLSGAVNNDTGLTDSSIKLYPYPNYGDQNILRKLIDMERPDAILHFTDPRFWIWLYQMEHEIRSKMPLFFYHIWDDLPFPKYNENYYRSCDWIGCISKQTYNIVRNVWKKDGGPKDWQVRYVPHGINSKMFKPLPPDDPKLLEMKKSIFKGEDVDFVVLYNNRNIRRKCTGNVILAYKKFFDTLTDDQKKRTRLILHTQAVDQHGTDLFAVVRDCASDIPVIFSEARLTPEDLNCLYNLSDVTINLANAEGFGLGTAESIMAGTCMLATVTGGLQDQMGFKDENGNYLDPDTHFNESWGTNHDGKYKDHGEWVFPVYPASRSLIGSPETPYIFEDVAKWEDAADELRKAYDVGREKLRERALKGREYFMTDGGLSSKNMADQFIAGMDQSFIKWKPRKRFEMFKV